MIVSSSCVSVCLCVLADARYWVLNILIILLANCGVFGFPQALKACLSVNRSQVSLLGLKLEAGRASGQSLVVMVRVLLASRPPLLSRTRHKRE